MHKCSKTLGTKNTGLWSGRTQEIFLQIGLIQKIGTWERYWRISRHPQGLPQVISLCCFIIFHSFSFYIHPSTKISSKAIWVREYRILFIKCNILWYKEKLKRTRGKRYIGFCGFLNFHYCQGKRIHFNLNNLVIILFLLGVWKEIRDRRSLISLAETYEIYLRVENLVVALVSSASPTFFKEF